VSDIENVLEKDLDDLLGGVRVMLILRALDPEATLARAEEAWAAGVRLIEVTIGTPAGIDSLRAAVEAGRERGYHVAAGTVLTADAAVAAAEAGAVCTVAPGFDPAVLAASAAAGVPHLPGVATPSEVHRATTLGCRWLKAFPAVSLGPAWFSAVRGPFPDVRFVATGGITVETAPAFLGAGVAAVGIGSAAGNVADLAALAGG
jgi:2-dehydro-3-deoxyphosphogluconate aldolase/(4S)-4-hydroxy-2-oxoglutarate aldolase